MDYSALKQGRLGGLLAVCLTLLVTTIPASTARPLEPRQVEFVVTGGDYRFRPSQLNVRQNDLIKVIFRAEDISHSFTIDSYRIAKRAGAGQTVEFEFRASHPGRFPIYCNLASDDRCRQMRSELIVEASTSDEP